MKKLILITLCLLPLTTLASRIIASIEQNSRIDHAKELMGPTFKRSVVSKIGPKINLEQKILETVEKQLPKTYKKSAHQIANVIIEQSAKHSLDPYFVMAVISGESSFNPLAIGPVGEIGMMQIRPTTGEWIAKLNKIPWRGAKALKDPIYNIKLGTAYFSWLRQKFDGHGQLYLAAYNMGAGSVKKALAKNIMPKDYPRHVMKRYVAFYRDINTKM
jgi:soluble lytic murein transglycosylase